MTNPNTENNYFELWLTTDEPSDEYTDFQHIPLSEIQGSRQQIFTVLAERVFIHHNDPDKYTSNLAALGYPEAAAIFDKRPKSHNTRMCNFGEIVASEYLSQREGYHIPVFRLRYNPNPESSMKGDDVLAFKFGDETGRGREILIVEAKAYARFSTEVVEEAFNQLKNGYRPRPKSILFILEILADQKKEQELVHVRNFLNTITLPTFAKRNLLFLATGNKPRDPFQYINLQADKPDNLTAINLHLDDLVQLVNDLFDCEVEVNGSTAS
ncbi:MAG: DUF1837 domain-containing protein [Chloroflexi bacterium]|nr:DUF1837 domain-containing protein [Chloroflexota bacterium]